VRSPAGSYFERLLLVLYAYRTNTGIRAVAVGVPDCGVDQ